ncbi:MAG: triose-phosphate isomerase [Parcubacteria group bacterium]|nr:triose-phosphate isomerase [Parcubacteria group bacterium]
MKERFLLANFKMNLGARATVEYCKTIIKELKKVKIDDAIHIGFTPSFTALTEVATLARKSSLPLWLGAQDAFWKEWGAYTGEISLLDLKEIGARYVIAGHSERQLYLKEDGDIIRNKIKSIVKNNLIPVVCIGETLEERRTNKKDMMLITAIDTLFDGVEIKKENKIIIAYEPIWAIGTGNACSAPEAEYSARLMQQHLIEHFPASVVNKQIFFLYGGSVSSKLIDEFMTQKIISGFLVGGASLNLQEWIMMVKKMVKNSE